MRKNCLLLIALLPLYTVAQGLYDIDNITTIDLTFEETNWDEIMDDYYEADLDERLVGTIVINGEFYDSVGVKYKGNSTYSPDNLKNPLNIKIDHILDQKFQGYTTFKLSNGDKDPSFVREVLGYEIGRNYMDLPLANYAKVTINGDYYGLFTSVESINDDYQERRLFVDDDNVRIKCNPQSVMDGSSLKYLGSDTTNYYDYYELKSDLGWEELADFTYELAYNTETIEEHLDLDRAIWMLAYNNVMVNLDSYSGPFRQNYYMIQDDDDRFMALIWDLNQSMGSFSMVDGGGGMGGPPSLDDLIEMELFLREGDSEYPLIANLFAVPRYKKMYLAHLKTIAEEFIETGDYYARAEELQDVIATEVAAEPNGFFTPAEFESNLDDAVGGGPGPASVYGLSQVMDPRMDYYQSLPEWSYIAPTISDISPSTESPTAYADIFITATIEGASYAYLGYRDRLQERFTKVEMLDDGLHGDGAAGDGVYGAMATLSAKDVQYYIYADNDNAGKFSPVRAEHEYYHLAVTAPVVINEMMARNTETVTDQDDEYDDWLELYNTTDADIDLSGYYLSDRPNAEPLMWSFPEGTTIAANDYLIVWLDEDSLQEGLHANFKLSVSGETVSFTGADGFELSRVTMPEMYSSTTYGRYPNATGPYIRMFPTFDATNSYTALSLPEDLESNVVLSIYPNPAYERLIIDWQEEATPFMIYNSQGALIHQGQLTNLSELNVADWVAGMYILILPEHHYSDKFIVQH